MYVLGRSKISSTRINANLSEIFMKEIIEENRKITTAVIKYQHLNFGKLSGYIPNNYLLLKNQEDPNHSCLSWKLTVVPI